MKRAVSGAQQKRELELTSKNANGACSDVTITNEVRKAVSVRSTFVLIMMVRTYVEYDASIILRL